MASLTRLLLCLSLFLVYVFAWGKGYSPDDAHHALALCCVSYCDSDVSVDEWQCPQCHKASTNKPPFVQVIRNEKLEVKALVVLQDGVDGDRLLSVVFRGTVSKLNWMEDAWAFQEHNTRWPGAKIHRGFADDYMSVEKDIHRTVKTLINRARPTRVLVTGHSLGGALAALCAMELRVNGVIPRSIPLSLYTFGQPRVGNAGAPKLLMATVDEHYRVTHWHDQIPQLPRENMIVNHYRHGPREVWYNHENTAFKVCDGTGEDPHCQLSELHNMPIGGHNDNHHLYLDFNIHQCMHDCPKHA